MSAKSKCYVYATNAEYAAAAIADAPAIVLPAVVERLLVLWRLPELGLLWQQHLVTTAIVAGPLRSVPVESAGLDIEVVLRRLGRPDSAESEAFRFSAE